MSSDATITGAEDSVLDQLIAVDATLLRDAASFGPHDVNQLSLRLEAAVKLLSRTQASMDPESAEVREYVRQLVHCYVMASETSKIARSLETLVIATGPKCEEFVRIILREEIKSMLKSATTKNLQRVSAMLERSGLVQATLAKCLHLLVAKLCAVFSEMNDKSPDQISKEELNKFYITVKLSVQVCQVFPEVKRLCWSLNVPGGQLKVHRHMSGATDEDVNMQQCIPFIVLSMFTILTSKKWPREITLLAGAGVALIISSGSSPEMAIRCFFTAYNSVKNGCLSVKMGSLRLDDGSKDSQVSPTSRENRVAEIALLRSIISCATDNMISHDDLSSATYLPFLLQLFPLVCELCDSGTDYQYLSYQLLSLWYKKLAASLPALQHEDENFCVMERQSQVLEATLERLRVCWDSPVDGVSEFVVDTFKMLLDVWRSEVTDGQSSYTELAEELIVKVLQMSWHNRSRYKPLALLIPFVDTDHVRAFADW